MFSEVNQFRFIASFFLLDARCYVNRFGSFDSIRLWPIPNNHMVFQHENKAIALFFLNFHSVDEAQEIKKKKEEIVTLLRDLKCGKTCFTFKRLRPLI